MKYVVYFQEVENGREYSRIMENPDFDAMRRAGTFIDTNLPEGRAEVQFLYAEPLESMIAEREPKQ